MIETATHRVAATIQVGSSPLDLAVSPDGRRVYVTNSRSHNISVLDVNGLREVRKLPVSTARDGPYGIVVSPDGGRLYVTGIDGDQVLVLSEGSGVRQLLGSESGPIKSVIGGIVDDVDVSHRN